MSTPDLTPPLTARGLSKTFGRGGAARDVLIDIDLEVRPGLTAIIGPSGSGKSTLLFCLSGLERPTRGSVRLLGTELERAGGSAISRLHRERVGFVFQSYNLVPYLSAQRNAALPGLLAGRRDARTRADGALARLGLAEHARRPAAQLSGGQQQRVALARVLAMRPSVIFADEPTGALDTASSQLVMASLRERADEGAAVVVVTHELSSAALADAVVVLRDGRIRDVRGPSRPEQLAALISGSPDTPPVSTGASR